SLVEPILIDFAEASQTTVYLSIIQGDKALCTARHNGGQAIEVRWWGVGEARAFNRGTGPRVLLAFMDDASRQNILAGFDDGTAATLTAELESIRTNGFIVKHDEIALGLSAMAVPLLDENGEILGAVSTGGLTPRYVGAEQAKLLTLMLEAAENMKKAVRGLR
ncbi:MAG: IclR family transcriptional regulator C-terminal domain-containing protein, partial [Arenibacterium sp.]